jgi:DNA polymerase-3 subunit alpha
MSIDTSAEFTHLRVHSHFSFLSGTASVEELVVRASAEGFSSLALTDLNGLYGAVQFSRQCREAGIKPILGVTFDISEADVNSPADLQGNGQLTLLAMNPGGYRSLCRLSSTLLGHPEHNAASPGGLTWEQFAACRDGILCIAGGRGTWLSQLVNAGHDAVVRQYLTRIKSIFAGDCYLGVESLPSGASVSTERMVALAEDLDLAYVALQPVYTLHPEDRSRLRLLAAIDKNCSLDEVPETALPGGGDATIDLHWLTRQEVAARHADHPLALTCVSEIIDRCEPSLPEKKFVWPVIDLPDGETQDSRLESEARKGLIERFGRSAAPEIHTRLRHELDVIRARAYAALFLIVADIVRFAHGADIPVSTRGSVANSLVAYCLGITSVDPIEHDLLFERFLNPERVDLPDIDLDFCSRRRDEILEYVRNRFGADRVALVATVSSMQPKSAVGETAKALGLNKKQINRLTSMLPRRWHPDPRKRDRRGMADLLAQLTDPLEREVVLRGYQLLGQPHHLSVHPGGVVIASGPLPDYLPVQWASKGFLITQYNHADLEAIGVPKFDLLGIRALTVLNDAAGFVRSHHIPDFHLNQIPLDDAPTAALLSSGDTIGVFQAESAGAQRTLRQLKAKSVQDLAIANAFFKPGPAMGGMVRSFVRRYRGEESVRYLHPALEPILRRTKGVLIFQEQILRLAREIAGLRWEEADHLRRGMSKFQPEEMNAMRARFIAGCTRPESEGPGLSSRQAEQLWEQVEAFAGYGFNQGHATAYAAVSYRSAYLKAHWPEAFLCARLAGHGGYHHPAIYIAEARRLGIAVRPPHVNHSERRFTLEYQSGGGESCQPVLWMGLDQIRDLRRRSISCIRQERSVAEFKGVRDLLGRVKMQQKEVVHLVQAGAFDGLVESRAMAIAEVEDIFRAGTPQQISFEFVQRSTAPPESAAQRLTWEREIMGFPVSVNPLQLVSEDLQDTTPLRALDDAEKGTICLAGFILPGRPGRSGFFFGDGNTFVRARFTENQTGSPPGMKNWQPVRLYGTWRLDEWGGGWFRTTRVKPLALAQPGRDDF